MLYFESLVKELKYSELHNEIADFRPRKFGPSSTDDEKDKIVKFYS
jgi:hypothetical protein